MVWLPRFLTTDGGRAAALSSSERQALADWFRLPQADVKRSHYHTRYVVVDVETTAFNLRTGRLTAIGALAVVNGQIDFRDAFEARWSGAGGAVDRQPGMHATPGAEARDSAAAQQAPVDVLLRFLQFAGKSPLVAFHALFTSTMINREVEACFGVNPEQRWIDLAWVLADLYRDLNDQTQGKMDGWLTHFGIGSIERHRAISDAFATARLLQITLARAARKGFSTPASLSELEKARRQLHQSC